MDHNNHTAAAENTRKAAEEIPDGASSGSRGISAHEPYPMTIIESGDGSRITDIDDNVYIDCHCGYSSVILGHTPRRQVTAVKRQVENGPYFGTAHELEYQTAKRVHTLFPGERMTNFFSTGTEAVDSALRLARSYTGGEKILKFEGMYHGHTNDVLVSVDPPASVLGTKKSPVKIPKVTGIPSDAYEHTEVLPWNDAALLEEKMREEGDQIAAVITEAVLSNGGLAWPTEDFVQELDRIAGMNDVLLVLDEVVTGFRMGLRGAQGYFDIDPDLTIFGKALANGYPVSAVTGKSEIMNFISGSPDTASTLGTFSGNPLVLSAAKESLGLLSELGERGYDEFRERGDELVAAIREIFDDSPHHGHVTDFAGFFYVYFTNSETDTLNDWRDIEEVVVFDRHHDLWKELRDEGVLIPPQFGRLNLTHAHTDADIEIIREAVKSALERIETGDVDVR